MAGRISTPFVPERYDNSAYTRSMSDLIRSAGDVQAQAALERGRNAANLGANIANIAGNVAGQIGSYYADEPRREAQALEVQNRKDAMGRENAIRDVTKLVPPGEDGRPNLAQMAQEIQRIDPIAALDFYKAADAQTQNQLAMEADRTNKLAKMLMGFAADTKKLSPPERQAMYTSVREQALSSGLAKPEDIPERYSPAFVSQMRAVIEPLDSLFKRMDESAQKEGFTLSPGQTRFDAEGNTIAAVEPAPDKPQTYKVTVAGPGGQPVDKLVTAEELAAGVPVYQAPDRASQEPLVAVMGEDGSPVLVRRSQAEGMRPASNREQGRPVTSGDAGKLTELDTSLNDLQTLRSTLTQTATSTGTMARAGAALPNAVTELTGWGEGAKERQAVIDRVKQVIGKALEGGVLRKEDEYKYTKILPTIGDTQAVAASKLDGLEKALVQRRSIMLDNLRDAGYDTSRFGETPAVPSSAGGVSEGSRKPIPGIPGGEAEFRNGKWIRVK